ncbi:helix-turn-helix domain-containing protein [Corynebacterium urealyticum]|uniref:Helix-turn-helix domain-containing protein n=1 Tax=Corynebacterium urealyticum (strain ATCC 43042 / DSM 7109) TaxID=504474 RepID=B1VGQ4_CORU7|nr:helix-turn-helix domain-containing protein [Corynebacterium urealyticum]QQC41244.1 helix-turn-helix domain-containing protein [Corynebacterium urealyticum]QQE51626.1 helix-turn-helix domain-containing protein [Corynebacterium urealyticum]CAQ05361.1 hypothetical protein cu1401 [Corynebacterium urealyticum DSM 7109]SNV88002.1 Helix-turn-helix domain [Corynebacterium urealyticum]
MREILTTSEVAELLGIGLSTVTWRARQGRLPVLQQISGRGTYLFDGETIRKMADRAGRENTTDQAPQTEPPK